MRGGMSTQTQQRSHHSPTDTRQSKSQQSNGGSNKMNAENSKNWRDDAKGKL